MNTTKLISIGATVAIVALTSVVANAASLTTIHNFAGGPGDGSVPKAGVVRQGNFLYGTTCAGGAGGFGTVFKMNKSSGALSWLHSFTGTPDGGCPAAKVIHHGGLYWGTTSGGGSSDNGSTFQIDTTGSYTQLTSFTGSAGDGSDPLARLRWVNGNFAGFYGTTEVGGSGAGSIFWLHLVGSAWTETPIYAFTGPSDGVAPVTGLVRVGQYLFGTTEKGGSDNGTIFRIKIATGAKNIWWSFTNGSDGANPNGGLVSRNGLLYGTTEVGGSGSGTVFSIDPAVSGSLTTLYQFSGGSDGARPKADLVFDSAGTHLYGTTTRGSGTGCYENLGCGTAFQFDLSTLSITDQYSFTGGTDGGVPLSDLFDDNGTFYGTTSAYGDANSDGTVFSVTF